MKKLKLKKWVKTMLKIVSAIFLAVLITYFILTFLRRIDQISGECDNSQNKICNYYEARKEKSYE